MTTYFDLFVKMHVFSSNVTKNSDIGDKIFFSVFLTLIKNVIITRLEVIILVNH